MPNNLVKIVKRSAKRLGRGLGSGKGKTAGRGTKGQKSRSGFNIPRRFEGGQTPLIQKLPKVRGFRAKFAKPQTITLKTILAHFNDGETVNFKNLKAKGLMNHDAVAVKIVGPGEISKKLKFAQVKLTKALVAQLPKVDIKPEVKEESETPKTETKKTAAKKPAVKKAPAKKTAK